jgi:hypothetical protein
LALIHEKDIGSSENINSLNKNMRKKIEERKIRGREIDFPFFV